MSLWIDGDQEAGKIVEFEGVIAECERSLPAQQQRAMKLAEQRTAEEAKLEGLFEALKAKTGALRTQVSTQTLMLNDCFVVQDPQPWFMLFWRLIFSHGQMEEKQKVLVPLRKDVNEKQSRVDVVESEMQLCTFVCAFGCRSVIMVQLSL